MELGPIFRALLHNKTRFWLITLEVALTLAIVVNCVSMLVDLRNDLARETGFDLANLVVVHTEPFGPEFQEEDFQDVVRERDLARLRALPGVSDAAGFHQAPLSGSGSSTSRRVVGTDLQPSPVPYFVVTENAVSTLGVELVEGRLFEPGDFEEDSDDEAEEDEDSVDEGAVILSQALADQLFPEGGALGSQLENDSGSRRDTVVGIVRAMENSWPLSPVAGRSALYPGKPGNSRRMIYLVRAEPGAVDAIFNQLETEIVAVNPDRIVQVETLAETYSGTLAAQHALVKILSGLIALLILVTSLGIVGLTSFSVTQRRKQIGTRRALGASRFDIVRYFLVENWMITGAGLVLGLGLTYALNYLLTQFAEVPKMQLSYVAAGMVALWLTGILAALAPALRAAEVAPVTATRPA